MNSGSREDGMRLHDAILVAAKAHKGQVRKGTDIDYLVHPMEVLEILATMEADANLRIAGILHDTVEDTELTLEDITRQFGADVAELVRGHSEDKAKSWEERKKRNVEKLLFADIRHQMLTLADGLSNLRSMAADYRIQGDQLWGRFRAPKEKQKWYYGAMKEALSSLCQQEQTCRAYQEWEQLYQEVFADYRQ